MDNCGGHGTDNRSGISWNFIIPRNQLMDPKMMSPVTNCPSLEMVPEVPFNAEMLTAVHQKV